MTRYWWVNHSKTMKQERDGGYLWSPKKEKAPNSADRTIRSQYYDNMRSASPGDFVVSYAKGKIRDIGRVTDFAITAGKPEEFGADGSSWGGDGWLLPAAWSGEIDAKPLQSFVSDLQELLPKKYSPLNRIGQGAQKAYLTEIQKPAFEMICRQVEYMVPGSNSTGGYQSGLSEIVDRIDKEVERAIIKDPSLSSTEKSQLIVARKGQGRFRENVMKIDATCRLTGVSKDYLLVASHIKPWRLCASSIERLDGNNGLMLTAHADFLFDGGFIGFLENGEIIVSPRLDPHDLKLMGLSHIRSKISQPFLAAQLPYLKYHREDVFLK